MAVRSMSELKEMFDSLIGERTDDEAITLLEDLSDTVADIESKIGEDWKAKYKENDASWRERYRKRFSEGIDVSEEPTTVIEDNEETEDITDYNDLFEEV